MINKEIRAYRNLRNLTQVQVAEMYGTSQSYIAEIERDANLNIATILKLGDILGFKLTLTPTVIDKKHINFKTIPPVFKESKRGTENTYKCLLGIFKIIKIDDINYDLKLNGELLANFVDKWDAINFTHEFIEKKFSEYLK